MHGQSGQPAQAMQCMERDPSNEPLIRRLSMPAICLSSSKEEHSMDQAFQYELTQSPQHASISNLEAARGSSRQLEAQNKPIDSRKF